MSFTESLERIVEENRNHLVGKHASWERVRLGDIARVLNGFPFESSQFTANCEGGHPLIRIRDILRSTTDTYYSGEVDPAYVVKSGDLIVGMDGDFNSVVWQGEPGLLNQRVCKISLNSPSFDCRFLAYCLPGYLSAINAHTSSLTVKHLSSLTIAKIPLPLPPLAEQRRIADALDELLSDLEAGVAALERIRAKLGLYRASVLKAATEGKLTSEWRQQHPHTEPASELLKRILAERRCRWEEERLRKFKHNGTEAPRNWNSKYSEPTTPDTTNLPPLPDSWCWAGLDQIADIAGGVTKGQKFASSDRTRLVPYLRVANVQRGFLDLSEIKEIRALESDIKALRLLPGDLLFNEGGDRDKLGRGWIWEGQVPECIHQNHVFRARLFLPQMQPRFVSWCGNSYGQLWFMKAGKQSVNLASINLTVLRSFPVPLPPLSEQEAIIEAVEEQLSVIEHMEADLGVKLKSAQALEQSILRHAFTGQLVSQDPIDEPASSLLERIASECKMRAGAAAAARLARNEIKGRGMVRHRRRRNLEVRRT
jgi:type I restriction enzyme S subunit